MSEEIIEAPPIDKSTWPAGPWKTEPDRLQWQHAGYACLIVRGRMGQLCGYVGVDETHPDFGKAYDDLDVAVHGGLTYANECHGYICHVPEPGMPANVWWFGFDAAHCWDLIPGMLKYELEIPALQKYAERTRQEDTYRDLEYMKAETERLAEQFRAIAV